MAEVWWWIVGYAILLVVVQIGVALYYRLRDGESTPSAAGDDELAYTPYPSPERPSEEPSPEPSGDKRRCPYCGTENEVEPMYRYCRSCVGELG